VDPAVTSSNGPIFTNNHSFKYDCVCVFKSSQWSIKQVQSGFAGLSNGRENSKEVALEREATTSRERIGQGGPITTSGETKMEAASGGQITLCFKDHLEVLAL
jgi:hypothetical protein